MSGTEWQDTPSVSGTGAGFRGRNWSCFPWAELNDLKLTVRKSDYLVHFEFSQQIDISLEYPSRM